MLLRPTLRPDCCAHVSGKPLEAGDHAGRQIRFGTEVGSANVEACWPAAVSALPARFWHFALVRQARKPSRNVFMALVTSMLPFSP